MNRLVYLVVLILSSFCLYGQSEFKTYENGLIYSAATVKKLQHVVDSLNLKYKTCDLNKIFYSKYQTIGHSISLDTNDIKQAKTDIENGIPFEDFLTKYPYADVYKNVLVVKYKDTNLFGRGLNRFVEQCLDCYSSRYIHKFEEDQPYFKPLKNSWIYEYEEKSEFSKESIKAFFFPEEFKSIPLSRRYCLKIGYSDCLIDTATSIFFKDAKENYWTDLSINLDTLSEKEKVKLLEKMRSTIVVGGCSLDSRPREQAMNIAMLSAETMNWEIFLQSHLNIMNDNVERNSNSNYAQAERKTYIKELEALNINVPDLLLGTSLEIQNPAEGHYYSSIERLGRAIAESKDKSVFKKEILSMIEDNELDYYNRVLSYFLFLNFNYYIEDKAEKKENLKLLKESIKKMPDFMKDKIKIDED